MSSPKNKREIQKLTGRIVTLNIFISRSTDKCLPFFKLLKGNKKFEWNEQCQLAFDELKRYLSNSPIVSKPLTGKSLVLYLAVTEDAMSVVLIREANGEHPVYYVSKSLLDAETRYPVVEKLALALITAARKLRPYFQSHSNIIMSTYPLRSILHSPNLSGRLTKWVIEFSEFDIEYWVRTSLKSQVFADFVAELTPDPSTPKTLVECCWTLMVDEASNVKGSGVRVFCKSPDGEVIEQSFGLGFSASNNEAEYEALIAGLRLAKALRAR